MEPAPCVLQLDENERAKRNKRCKLDSDNPALPGFQACHACFQAGNANIELLDNAFQAGNSGPEISGFAGGCCSLHCVAPFSWDRVPGCLTSAYGT